MHVHVISRLEELAAFRTEWNRLYDSLPDDTIIFSSWDYIHGYVSFHRPENWSVIVLFPDQTSSRPIAIFPIERLEGPVAGNPLRVCRSLGFAYAGYVDYLVSPAHRIEAFNVLFAVLKNSYHCDALLFGWTLESSKNYILLLESAQRDEVRNFRNKNTPYIDTRSVAIETFFAGKKKSTQADAQRCIRRLSEQGVLAFSSHAPDESQIEALLDRHAQKFSVGHHYDVLNPNWQGFFNYLATTEAYRNLIDYSALTLNGSTIAAHLGFKGKGRKIYSLPVYDEAFDRYSPSKVLLFRLIETAFAERSVFCFGPGLFPYKEDWCQATAELKSLWFFLTPLAKAVLPDRVRGSMVGLFDEVSAK